MNQNFVDSKDHRIWNRRILYGYWLLVLVILFGEILIACFSGRIYDPAYVIRYIIMPPAILTAILLVTECFHFLFQQVNDYIIIIAANLLSITLILSHSNVEILQGSLILPIIISTFYFSKRKTFFATILSLVSLFLIYALFIIIAIDSSITNIVSTIFFLIAATYASIGIMSRGIEFIEHLKNMVESKQELLVKNIIMERLSKLDHLTELYNHITFHEYLEKLIEQCEEYDLAIQLAIIDIDNFKHVNDTYGHRVGDVVLKRVADTIKGSVSLDNFVARYGGEEFAVIFTDQSLEAAYTTVEEIRHKISMIIHPELDNKNVTVSVGLNTYIKGIGKEKLFTGADQSLYTAKRSGKNMTIIDAYAESTACALKNKIHCPCKEA